MNKNYWEAEQAASASSAKPLDIADVTIVLDRSGSMASIRDAMILATNNFIAKMKTAPGTGCWTMFQFDDPSSAQGAGEAFPHVAYAGKSDRDVPGFEFTPRGGTALVDAVCDAIAKTKQRLNAMTEVVRKATRVLFVIITDGEENSSKRFSSAQMREMIAECQGKLGWEFMYMAANQDAFAVAHKYDMDRQGGFNYPGLQGVFTSGSVTPGTAGTAQGTQYANSSVLPMQATAAGVAECVASGLYGAQAWRAATPNQ